MRNRICIHKPTQKLIEVQSGEVEKLGTLTANAIMAGYKKSEIEEKYTDDNLEVVLRKYETEDAKNDRLSKETKEAAKQAAISLNKDGLSTDERVERIETVLGI